jgi:DNA-binding beta-propeller fold protein YncE
LARTELVVALGKHFYSVERPWGILPDGMLLSSVSDVAVDSRDQVYVFQRSEPPVVVFDSDGGYLRSWGSGLILDPHGIFSFNDRIYLTDRDAHQIQQYDTEGNMEAVIGERHRPSFQAPFNSPADVAVAPTGDIYVADGYGNSTIHWYSANGKLLRSWGKPGKGPGEFTTPHAIRIHPDGRVLVADRENDRVQVFTRDGDYLDEWHDLYHPMDIYVDPAGLVYVTDQVPRLSLLSTDGVLVGRCRPSTYNSHGVFGDSQGNIYLAEPPPEDRITRLTPMPDATGAS